MNLLNYLELGGGVLFFYGEDFAIGRSADCALGSLLLLKIFVSEDVILVDKVDVQEFSC